MKPATPHPICNHVPYIILPGIPTLTPTQIQSHGSVEFSLRSHMWTFSRMSLLSSNPKEQGSLRLSHGPAHSSWALKPGRRGSPRSMLMYGLTGLQLGVHASVTDLPSHPLWCHYKQWCIMATKWPGPHTPCIWHLASWHSAQVNVHCHDLKWSYPHPIHTHISYPHTYPMVCKADQTLFRINNHLEWKSELNYKP